MNVNKELFAQQLVDKYNYTKSSALELVDSFWSVVKDNVEAGNSITFFGYGTFDLVLRKERLGVHPATGERCLIPESWTLRFFPGKTLKRSAKKWHDSKERGLI